MKIHGKPFSKPTFLMTTRINLDKIGIGTSLLCAVHCILLPVLFTTLPLMGVEILENELLELVFILFSLIIGCLAMYNGYSKHHHKLLPLVLFILGISLLFFANFFLEDNQETIIKIIGATTLIIAHLINWQNCKRCIICTS